MRRIALALAALLCAAFLGAQTSQLRELRPGDVIRIRIFQEQEINETMPIGADGYISAPFIGSVLAAGKTPAELEEDLRQLYVEKLRLRDPLVSVTVVEFRPIQATVLGAVNRPGTYTLRPGDTVLTLLGQGGDARLDGSADLRHSTLRRAGTNEVIPLDLFAMLKRADMSQNYEIRDGDVLEVSVERVNNINVLGRVARPGAYPFREPMRLVDAFSMAGGEIPYRTKASEVAIIRRRPGHLNDYITIEADLVRFWNKGDYRQNILLEPGDVIYVPDSGNIDFGQVNAIANIFFILDRVGFSILP